MIVKLISSPTNKNTSTYRHLFENAQEIISLLEMICHENESQESVTQLEETPNISIADEIRQYKALCDDGIITQEEFEAKKKQLLGL